jgi:hypothetical protein
VPFHRTPEMGQPPTGMDQPQAPLINGGQPGVYSMPGQPQSMNDQPQIDPLAAALAGQGDPNNPAMAPGMVALLNDQPFGFNAPPVSSADFSMPDFNFGGLFG